MKRIALLLVLAAACKTTDSSPPAAKNEPAPTPTDRAPRTAPTLPGTGDTAGSGEERPPARAWDGKRGGRWAQIDTDGDGKISDAERAAAMKQRAEQMRSRLDTNNDGKLTPEELAAAPGRRMHFDDPAALDTNKDGDISADELAAGMLARRDAMRTRPVPAGSGGATE